MRAYSSFIVFLGIALLRSAQVQAVRWTTDWADYNISDSVLLSWEDADGSLVTLEFKGEVDGNNLTYRTLEPRPTSPHPYNFGLPTIAELEDGQLSYDARYWFQITLKTNGESADSPDFSLSEDNVFTLSEDQDQEEGEQEKKDEESDEGDANDDRGDDDTADSPVDSGLPRSLQIGVGVGAGIGGLVILGLVIWAFWWRRQRARKPDAMGGDVLGYGDGPSELDNVETKPRKELDGVQVYEKGDGGQWPSEMPAGEVRSGQLHGDGRYGGRSEMPT